MIKVLSFLSQMERELWQNYEYGSRHKAYWGRRITKDPRRYNCTKLAKEVAKLLIAECKQPKIFRFGRQDPEDRTIFLDKLYPKKYPDHDGFYYHDVCVCDDIVWDPMIGKPLTVDEYCMEAFGEEFEMSEHRYCNKRILEESL